MHRRAIISIAAVICAGGAAAPAGSNPGSRLAFESDRLGPPGVMTLFAMRPDGTGVTTLGAPVGAADADWSPDGRRIAFDADPDGSGNPDVYVMNADGTDVRRLTTAPGPDFWPDWFPDGKRLAFTSFRDGAPAIYVMDADGGDQRSLTPDPGWGHFQPAVSPDGRQILFFKEGRFGPPPKIFAMDADGGEQRALTPPGPHRDLDAAWSPDGRRIAFASNRTGSFEIFVMRADGTEPTQLTAAPGRDYVPVFSPDGRRIAWSARREGNDDVHVMNADGTEQTRLTTDPGFDGFPDWHAGALR